jgi:hypothetical protein
MARQVKSATRDAPRSVRVVGRGRDEGEEERLGELCRPQRPMVSRAMSKEWP